MYDPFPNTLKARHLNFGAVGASSVCTSLIDLTIGTKAYYGYVSPETSPNHTNFYNSGYQYQPLTPGETTLTETFLFFDSVTQNPITTISEYFVTSDSQNSIVPANGIPDAIDYFPSTLKPTYNNFTIADTSCNHTIFNSVVDGNKTYNLAPAGVSCNQFAFRTSGYQFMTIGDPSYTTTLYEYFNLSDQQETETPGQTTLYEYFSVLDGADGPPILSENFVMLDSETQNPVTTLSETILLLDGASGEAVVVPNPVTFKGTMIMKVVAAQTNDFTLINKVEVATTNDYSLCINTVANDFVAVTNASSVSNPATPTFIDRNGVTLFSNPATVPDSPVPLGNCYVGLACNNLLSTISMTDVFSWNLNIGNSGGNWETLTNVDLPDFGSDVTLFGLNGIVTSKGYSKTNSSGGYENGGIFGTRNMNKQLAFLIYGQESYYYNALNQFVTQPDPTQYKSHKDAVQFIANLAGVSVGWMGVTDFPLVTFQPQASQTVQGALSSLAEEVGAVLRWSGNSGYKIIYPDVSLGSWTIPDCCLIQAVSKRCNLDLNTGFYSPGARFVPQLSPINGGTKSVLQAGNGTFINNNPLTTPNEQYSGMVEAKATIGQRMTTSDASIPIDIPTDAVGVMIRVINNSGRTGPYVVQQSQIDDGSDPWFYLEGVPGTATAGNHISVIDKDGLLKFSLNVKPDLFDDDWADGDKMQFGIIRRSQPYKDNAEGSSLLFAGDYLRYQFIPVCTGSVTCIFFGSMPMPGMDIVAEFDGQQITGIIESVSYHSPGIITVNYVQWARLQYYQQLSESGNF